MSLEIRVFQQIGEIQADAWNTLCGEGYPFLRHEFLHALERNHCVGEETGWLPWHLGFFGPEGELVAASPLYIKHNSFGEFVFDWAWADAYRRAGHPYYPKLLAASPFTPATGPKLLIRPDHSPGDIEKAMVDATISVGRSLQVSSLHWLFVPDPHFAEKNGLLTRMDYQFHWSNQGYTNFDDFLSCLKSAKRKQIKKERRQVAQDGIDFEHCPGSRVPAADWLRFCQLYRSTFAKYGNYPALTAEFFQEAGRSMGDRIMLVLARQRGEIIAASYFLVGEETLYGRYWGCAREIPALHFETCYYQGIEYCIRNKLKRFEPGAQGEHKLSRGFLPTPTWSAHWIADPNFRRVIGDFLSREIHWVRTRMNALYHHSPYKDAPCG